MNKGNEEEEYGGAKEDKEIKGKKNKRETWCDKSMRTLQMNEQN